MNSLSKREINFCNRTDPLEDLGQETYSKGEKQITSFDLVLKSEKLLIGYLLENNPAMAGNQYLPADPEPQDYPEAAFQSFEGIQLTIAKFTIGHHLHHHPDVEMRRNHFMCMLLISCKEIVLALRKERKDEKNRVVGFDPGNVITLGKSYGAFWAQNMNGEETSYAKFKQSAFTNPQKRVKLARARLKKGYLSTCAVSGQESIFDMEKRLEKVDGRSFADNFEEYNTYSPRINSYYRSKEYTQLDSFSKKAMQTQYDRLLRSVLESVGRKPHQLNTDETILFVFGGAKFDMPSVSVKQQDYLCNKLRSLGYICYYVDEDQTSQKCSCCGNQVLQLPGWTTKYCTGCKILFHRDVMASKNMAKLGIQLFLKKGVRCYYLDKYFVNYKEQEAISILE